MSRLLDTLQAIARHEVGRRTYCELAVVTSSFDDADGADSHSVSVKLKDTGLAISRVPVASGVTGGAALPRQGDVVLVLMPRGDVASAVVAAQVYSDERRPPVFERDEAALVWPGDAADPETEAVAVRAFADGSQRRFSITLGGDSGAAVTVADGAVELTCGGAVVKLGHSSGSDGSVEVAAGGTRIELAQDGDLTIEAAGTLKLKAPTVEIAADAQLTLNGQTVGIN